MPNPTYDPTVIIADAAIDPDKFLFEGVDTTEFPTFSVGEVSKIFFARSPAWLRQMEAKGYFDVEGDIEFTPRRFVSKNARFFCLEDIEKVAHALTYHQAIPATRLRIILTMLKAQGQLWGYIGT